MESAHHHAEAVQGLGASVTTRASDGALPRSQVQSVHYCRGNRTGFRRGPPSPGLFMPQTAESLASTSAVSGAPWAFGPGIVPPSSWSRHTTVLWGRQRRSRPVGGEAGVPWRPTSKRRIVYKAGQAWWARCPEMAPVSCHLYDTSPPGGLSITLLPTPFLSPVSETLRNKTVLLCTESRKHGSTWHSGQAARDAQVHGQGTERLHLGPGSPGALPSSPLHSVFNVPVS